MSDHLVVIDDLTPPQAMPTTPSRRRSAKESNRNPSYEEEFAFLGIQYRYVATVELEDIERYPDSQARIRESGLPVVQQYARKMKEGQIYPPVTLWQDGSDGYFLVDGNTRVAAKRRNGTGTTDAYILDLADKDQAVTISATLNTLNGAQLNRDELQRAMMAMTRLGLTNKTIARKLGETFGLDRCSIFLSGEKSEVRLVASYEDPTIRNLIVDLNRYPELKRAFDSGETVFIPDAANDPELRGIKALDSRNVRSIVVVPIRWEDSVIGAIFLRTEREAEPFSDTEDRALAFGLQGVPVDQGGVQVYFGLAGNNLEDDERTIAFFQPERERFLEYDLTKLIYDLSNPKRPVVGIMSSLPLDGDPRAMMMAMRGQPAAGGQPYASTMLLRQTNQVKTVNTDAQVIDPDIQVLLVAAAQKLSDATLYAIDQFVMRGGRLMAMVDPWSEAMAASPSPNGMPPTDTSSDLKKLFDAWGIVFDPTKVVGDLTGAWRVRANADERVQAVNYVAWFNIRDGINHDDPASADLQQVTVASSGSLSKAPNASIEFTPLLSSSARSSSAPSPRPASCTTATGASRSSPVGAVTRASPWRGSPSACASSWTRNPTSRSPSSGWRPGSPASTTRTTDYPSRRPRVLPSGSVNQAPRAGPSWAMCPVVTSGPSV
jgi:ABC-type uncharacterized transport system involved in gliding motility auxiliary subunit